MSTYWSEIADLARQVASASKRLEDFFQRVPDPWKAADKKAFAALHADLLQAQDAYSSFEHSKLDV
ncbi:MULTISPECIES: hypothetical protein [unclassified Pseudomonas]|jgi:hypothetical protein|uniref:hypothetical protein n=1 Tax=unclassified Pseudomonas TaxID=196821 RepID=UPI0015A3597F|nr:MULTISPECIES: hypothetical protein [unclassified Pseudomonas]NWB68085.1 hypothetical protein [Pseudomonas sp. I8001]NWD65783.1 hypothetical protein [Pseudomonas sp. IPO3774]